jgi:hypothetical protein
VGRLHNSQSPAEPAWLLASLAWDFSYANVDPPPFAEISSTR